MKRIVCALVGVILLFELWAPIEKTAVWLLRLNMTQSPVSMAGEIFVKITVLFLSYAIVGAIFKALGWFNSEAMKIAYFVVSTLLTFGLCYLVMLFEEFRVFFV